MALCWWQHQPVILQSLPLEVKSQKISMVRPIRTPGGPGEALGETTKKKKKLLMATTPLVAAAVIMATTALVAAAVIMATRALVAAAVIMATTPLVAAAVVQPMSLGKEENFGTSLMIIRAKGARLLSLRVPIASLS